MGPAAGTGESCGGDALMRVAALQVRWAGTTRALIAGEEPEMCVRLRAAGWQIWCLDAEMTLHDAAMTRLGQFWKRAIVARAMPMPRARRCMARPPNATGSPGRNRALFWGFGLPVALVLAGLIHPAALLGFLGLSRAG
jgi:hypothetical protein